MALSFARDEIIWLLRHADNMPKKSADDFIDKYVDNLQCDSFNICKNLMEEIHLKAREYQRMISWQENWDYFVTVLIFSSKQKSGGIYCVRNCCTNGKNSFYAEDLFVKENYFVVHFMHFFFL